MNERSLENTMGPSRYSLRSLFIAVTLFAIGIGAWTWCVHSFNSVTIDHATPEQANRVLRGYATVPAKATDVYVQYTPMSTATIEFDLSESEARAWCERNNWKVIPEANFDRFEFTSPRGSGVWFEGRTQFILISDLPDGANYKLDATRKGNADMFALGFFDYVIIAVIVSIFGGGAAAVFKAQDKVRLARLEAKVDLLLDQAGLELDDNAQLPEDVRKAIQEEEEKKWPPKTR